MRDRKKKKIFYKNYKRQFKVGKIALGIGMIVIVLSLSLFYLSQTNHMAAKGYDISDLEKRKEELIEEKERLEIEAARLQSIQEIQQEVSRTDMVPTKKINFVKPASDVALNR